MIHIGEQTLQVTLEQHQRASRTQCLCGAELHAGMPAHLVDVITHAQQD